MSRPPPTEKKQYANWYDHKAALITRPRGDGQEGKMKGWNALAYARYACCKLKRLDESSLDQDWEWLHVKGAQIGGETEPYNLVAGTATTNSRMIPIETKIKIISKGACQEHPLSLRFDAECEPDTNIGKKITIQIAAEYGLPKKGIPIIPKSNPVQFTFYPQSGQYFDRISEILYRTKFSEETKQK